MARGSSELLCYVDLFFGRSVSIILVGRSPAIVTATATVQLNCRTVHVVVHVVVNIGRLDRRQLGLDGEFHRSLVVYNYGVGVAG